MLKLSALISVIGVRELLLAAEQSASATFRYLEALSAAGVYYLAFTTVLMSLQRVLERRLGRPGLLATRLTADGQACASTDRRVRLDDIAGVEARQRLSRR
jgi:polar amino acid transport system permease protein